MPKLHLHTQWDSDQVTMDLAFNSDHIIYYHMDAPQLIGLVKTNFAHLDSLVVQFWIHTIHLSPDAINQTGPQTYYYVKVSVGRVEYMPLGAPCEHIMSIIDQFNAAMLFVVTTFPAL